MKRDRVMSFVSKRDARHTQLVRLEGSSLPEEADDGQPIAHLRLDNWDRSEQEYTPLGDVAVFRSKDEPTDKANGRIVVRPYTAGIPTEKGSVTFTHTGRVGIGISDPARTLDVCGSIGCETLYSNSVVNGSVSVGNTSTPSGVDMDVAGDVRCRNLYMRRLVSSAFAGTSLPVPLPLAMPGTNVGFVSDVSLSGTDAEGTISIVVSDTDAGGLRIRTKSRGSPTSTLATIVLGQPMPCAVRLTPSDDTAAAIGRDVYGAPTAIGFEMVVARDALSKMAIGTLYRWSYASAGIPRPPFPSRGLDPNPLPITPSPYPTVTPASDVQAGGVARVMGTDSAGIVRAMFGSSAPLRGIEPTGGSRIAQVRFGNALPMPMCVMIAPWSVAAINAAVGAGVRRKPGSVAAIVAEDGTGFEIVVSSLDSRDHVPFAMYTWSYFVIGPDRDAPDAEPPAAAPAENAAVASAVAHSASGPNSSATVSMVRPGAGIITLISGDPPAASMRSTPTVALLEVSDVAGMGSGASVCISAANEAAAALARSVSALATAADGFRLEVPSSPPQAPLWPHTKYVWSFTTIGVPRSLPTTPNVWYGPFIGIGGAVRVQGTDTSGSIDILFGDNSHHLARCASRNSSAKCGRIASLVFSMRFTTPVSVQVTCSRCPCAASAVPTMVAEPSAGGAGFDLSMHQSDRKRVQTHAVYTWSYVILGTSLTRR